MAVYALNPGQQDIFGNIITNQQARIYADPGTVILMGGTGTGTGIAGCIMVLSGYLVTL